MARVLVFHDTYGCETGCCGHTIRLEENGSEKDEFTFDHPYATSAKMAIRLTDPDAHAWAEEQIRLTFGEDHVADLDWDNSVIVDD